MLHQNPRAVNTSAHPSHTARTCDTCQRPVGTIAPITIADTTRRCCRLCRHSLIYGRFCNILRLIDRFFGEAVTA